MGWAVSAADGGKGVGEPADAGPDGDAVRGALADALASAPFRDAPQLRAFLTYVVTETLAGRAEDLKGYSIATLALGRPESFDPQADPIVRVQAGRVRQALAEYHADRPDAPILIRLEKGSYAPVFSWGAVARPVQGASESEALAGKPVPSAQSPATATRLTRRHAAFGGAVVVAVAAAVFWPRDERRPAMQPPQPQALPSPESYYPLLTIEAGSSTTGTDATVIVDRLRTAIAYFDDLVVVGDSVDMTSAGPSTLRQANDWNLVLKVTTTGSGNNEIRISLRLLSRRDQRLLWSREIEPIPRGPAGDRALSAAVRTIATALAQPYGVIHAHVRSLLAARADVKDPFGCVVAGLDYWLVNDRATHLAARTCIEGRLTSFPGFGPLHAQLAYLHLEEYRQGFNPLPGDARGRALESARKAVLYRPASARSHQSLMAALFASGDIGGAWRAAADALALNPNDTEIIADVGSYRVMAGDFETGLAYLDQAIDLNPAPPAWVITYRALALYLLERLEMSGPMARALEGANYPLAHMALVMAAFQFRDRAGGKRHLETFRRQHPESAADPAALLRRMNFQDAVITRAMTDFNRAVAWITGG
jgi:hypothetical protein